MLLSETSNIDIPRIENHLSNNFCRITISFVEQHKFFNEILKIEHFRFVMEAQNNKLFNYISLLLDTFVHFLSRLQMKVGF